jgi:hypothetical protein
MEDNHPVYVAYNYDLSGIHYILIGLAAPLPPHLKI